MLSHTHELNTFLDSEACETNMDKKKVDTILLKEWNNLRKLMWSQNCIIEPGRFIQMIQGVAKRKGQELFTGYMQNDVSEFLIFLIDCFHNSVSRPVTMNIKGHVKTKTDTLAVSVYNTIKKMYSTEYSEIWNMFYGMHVSELVSVDGKEIISQTPEPFFNISLPILHDLKTPTLTQCLDNYVLGEVLTGDNAWFNGKNWHETRCYKKNKVLEFS